MNERQAILIHAAGVMDAQGVRARPGMVAIRQGRIVYAGPPDAEAIESLDQPRRIDLPDRLILPAMVNAHAHLDLTLIGPRPRPVGGSFIDWVRMVMAQRPTDEQTISQAVARGLAMSAEAGVGFIGDIAGSPAAATALQRLARDAHVPGVSYLECFGIGAAEDAAVDRLKQQVADLAFETTVPKYERGVILGIQPHAPYSAGRAVYEAAVKLSQNRACRLCTHLAETQEEIEFVRDAAGPFVDLLRELGKWDASIKPIARHPVDYLEPMLRKARWLLVHCNYIEDEHIELLARTRSSVAYCPIASEYFGHADHRYRDMIEAGVNVCLGTDSILCQPAGEKQPLGMLAPMRRLFQRDGADPLTLLKMATVNGLDAMAIDNTLATFEEDVQADLVAVRVDPADDVDLFEQVLRSTEPAQRLAL